MKRLFGYFFAAIIMSALAVPVFAWGPGWGHGMMGSRWGGESGAYSNYGPGYPGLTEEQATRMHELETKFYNETEQLRRALWEKNRELNILLESPDPDTGKARALNKEIIELRSEIDEKSVEYKRQASEIGLDTRRQGSARGFGGSFGRGRGACWY